MTDFFAIAFGFPTILPTVLLGCCLLYWILVLFGALDIDVLDFGDVDLGPVAQAVQVVDSGGAGVQAATGAVTSVAGVATAGGGKVTEESRSRWSLSHLRRIPLTVTASVGFSLWWLVSQLATYYVVGVEDGFRTGHLVVFVVSLLSAMFMTWLVMTPIASLFDFGKPRSRTDEIAKIVDIRTSRVDRECGQAMANDGGAGLLLEVRADPAYGLKHGDKALIVSHDSVKNIYELTKIDDIFPSKNDPEQTSG